LSGDLWRRQHPDRPRLIEHRARTPGRQRSCPSSEPNRVCSAKIGKASPHRPASRRLFVAENLSVFSWGPNTIDLQWKMRTNYNARPCDGERKAAGAGTMANNGKNNAQGHGNSRKSGRVTR
jgi:hypothetical protein